MNRAFHVLMEMIFWVLIFLSPMLAFLAIGMLMLLYVDVPLYAFYTAAGVGILTGIFVAEKIRRKYGCVNYMSRILATPDIEPADNEDEKKRCR